MYHVKILRGGPIDSFTPRSLRDCCVSTNGDRDFAVVDVSTILRSREKMVVIAETVRSRNAMQFLRRPTGLCIQGIRSIIGSNRWGRLVMCVEKFDDLGCLHTFDGIRLLTLVLGTRRDRGRRNRLLEEKLGELRGGHIIEVPGAVGWSDRVRAERQWWWCWGPFWPMGSARHLVPLVIAVK
jgi:hypothetical protein